MSRPIVALAVLLALLVAGCGGVGEETITVVHYEHEVANSAVAGAIFGYVNALFRADGRAACARLTRPRARSALGEAKANFGVKAGSCAQALTWVGDHLSAADRAASIAVTDTRIAGRRATARLVGSGAIFHLVRRGGGWLIARGGGLWSAHPSKGASAGQPSA